MQLCRQRPRLFKKLDTGELSGQPAEVPDDECYRAMTEQGLVRDGVRVPDDMMRQAVRFTEANPENRCVVVIEAGSYLRLIGFCITPLKAQGPSRTCDESKEEEKKLHRGESPPTPPIASVLCRVLRGAQ